MSMVLTPFAQLPGEVLMDKRLNLLHIKVLIALYMHANKKKEFVWPKRKTISTLTGIHESTISRVTSELQGFGWVTKTSNTGGCGHPAMYRVHVPDNITSSFDMTVDEQGDIKAPTTTLADSTTVAESTTVADSATPTVAESTTPTVAESARGTEHTSEHTNEQTTTTTRQRVQESQQTDGLPAGGGGDENLVYQAARKAKLPPATSRRVDQLAEGATPEQQALLALLLEQLPALAAEGKVKAPAGYALRLAKRAAAGELTPPASAAPAPAPVQVYQPEPRGLTTPEGQAAGRAAAAALRASISGHTRAAGGCVAG